MYHPLWGWYHNWTLFCFPHVSVSHDDVIKWKHFPRYWPFVRGIHRLPVNSPHKGQWRGALMFSLICAWLNDWVNNREAGDLRHHRAHYDVIVIFSTQLVRCLIHYTYNLYWLTWPPDPGLSLCSGSEEITSSDGNGIATYHPLRWN